ncbi:glycosyltransferase family 2 protein [Kiritimatiellaeota bacterium B1221]|nr:glycosyltransferase family 2 protein [Kiritimatiellaeota bacterium B1221]
MSSAPLLTTETMETPVDFSVVIPCLNEETTLGICLEKAFRSMREHGINGEVIVADNGSTDGSVALAEAAGARVEHVTEKGYGCALMGGIESAKGKWILMADADDSYDFLEIPAFYDAMTQGYDLVQGCRLPKGGGTVMKGAMPPLHRWFGNPLFSRLARSWFKAPIHDIYCGMRAFTRELYDKLDLHCTGMEFATEMIIKASLYKSKIHEVPITLHPDGRTHTTPHLNTWHDGWRTLRFFLMSSPSVLFLTPGLILIGLGILSYGFVYTNIPLGGATLDAHSLLFATLAIILGYQAILFSLFTKIFAISDHLLPPDPRFAKFCSILTLERGVVGALVLLVIGLGLLTTAIVQWLQVGLGNLDYSHTMRVVIPGFMFTAVSIQTVFSGFFISILGMRKR